MAPKGTKLTKEQRKKVSEGLQRRFLESLESQRPEPEQKRCSKCREWKKRGTCSADSDFHWRKRKLKSGVVVLRLDGACKACKNAQNRQVHERERASGIDVQARWRRWFERKGVRYRKEMLRKKREREAERRRENGEQPKPRKGNTTHLKDRNVPIEPIACWLRGTGLSEDSIAAQSGVWDRRIGGILREEKSFVRLSTVDKILIGLDAPYMLHELYPEEP